jgi:D-3-phosphoglycerate dehydrogenase
VPEGSYLVNCARGGLLDYDAVLAALESGQLHGAAMDVYPQEPIPEDHPLLSAAKRGLNLVLTPHVAGASRTVAEKVSAIVAAEVGRHVRGESLHNVSNPEVLALRPTRG